jgi:predicted nucleotidyltransferase
MRQRSRTLPQLADLSVQLRVFMPELRERWHVSSLGVFGSYVRGEQRRSSDLDLLVDFDTPISLFRYIELENYLSDTLGLRVESGRSEGAQAEDRPIYPLRSSAAVRQGRQRRPEPRVS